MMSEIRLIDANALKEEFLKNEDRKGYLTCDWETIIDNAPTVDKGYQEGHIDGVLQGEKLYARPIGEWIEESKIFDGVGDSVLVNTCSICKTSFVYRGVTHNYCSNCGADMRGKE